MGPPNSSASEASVGFVLTDEDNAFYRGAGGSAHRDVMWTFSYADD